MKLLTTLLCLIAVQTALISQFSASALYSSNNSDIIDQNLPFEAISPASVELGLAYWFRLKSKRVEFLPELSYAFYLDSGNNRPQTFKSASALHFSFNTQIYPIDFHSDCNSCPTFSKDGGLVKKGFYWIISPGISSYNFEFFDGIMGEEGAKIENVALRIGLGAGLDIGLSNLLTISPFARYNISARLSDDTDSSTYKQFQFGLRAILRVDKDKW